MTHEAEDARKVVPREPTLEMMRAGARTIHDEDWSFSDLWRDMYDAAPAQAEPPLEHVCGLQGYNGMIDPPCPLCEWNKRRHAAPSPAAEDGLVELDAAIERATLAKTIDAGNQANASLIAAAPDLLAALRDIVAKWERGGYGDGPCPFMPNAIAAIARAEADAERLNWLEIHAGVRARTSRGAYSMEWLTNGRETLRAAIDRARTQGGDDADK